MDTTIIIEQPIDTARDYAAAHPGFAYEVLLRAQECWSAMSEFRKERQRNKDYVNGKQWGDKIKVCGKWMTEEEYLVKQGNVPLKNNLIRRLVRTVIGVFSSQNKEPLVVARDRAEQSDGEVLSTVLQYNWQRNNIKGLNTRTFEEFLVSGVMVHRKTYGWRSTDRGNVCDCWTDMVSPDRFFVDGNMQDFRTWDATIVGEIHDASFEDVCRVFAKSPSDYDALRREYSLARDRNRMNNTFERFGVTGKRLDFMIPNDPTVCRVIEVWTKEQKERYHCHDTLKGECYKVELDELEGIDAENEYRRQQAMSAGLPEDKMRLIKTEYFIDDYWYYRFITPTGRVLAEGETEYGHGSHPYVFRCYPFMDGEIHSFVSDLIDQQRYVNRLITMQDFIMRASAKGVLLLPKQALEGTDLDINDFAEEWSSYNGVIAYNAKPGVPEPKQIHGQVSNFGVADLLNLQLKFFEDISGVHGALQGQTPSPSTSGVLYEQQRNNAVVSLLDILNVMDDFVVDCAVKDLKNIQQYYDEPKQMRIAGNSARIVSYEPDEHGDIEFDMSVSEGTSTAAYRQVGNEFLMQLLQMQQISVEQLLEFGNFPNGDALLQSIQAAQEQMQAQQAQMGAAGAMPMGAPPVSADETSMYNDQPMM